MGWLSARDFSRLAAAWAAILSGDLLLPEVNLHRDSRKIPVVAHVVFEEAAVRLLDVLPQFAFFVNLPQYIKEPYRRFLENNIRDHWDFAGVPMQIYFRQK